MDKYQKTISELRIAAVHSSEEGSKALMAEAANIIAELRAASAKPDASLPNAPLTRAEVLRKAEECVCGHREQDYGSPEDSFELIARFWSAYLGMRDITPVDVSMMMALLKIARVAGGNGTNDSFIDLAGYAACGGEIAGKGKNEDG